MIEHERDRLMLTNIGHQVGHGFDVETFGIALG